MLEARADRHGYRAFRQAFKYEIVKLTSFGECHRWLDPVSRKASATTDANFVSNFCACHVTVTHSRGCPEFMECLIP
jgi:hypothetical protein